MATRTATQAMVSNGRGIVAQWTGLLNGDVGSAIELCELDKRSVQFTGVFGVGGTIVWEGSNDGTNYVTLLDIANASISKTAAALVQIGTLARYARPRVSGGDGTTSLVATLLAKGE